MCSSLDAIGVRPSHRLGGVLRALADLLPLLSVPAEQAVQDVLVLKLLPQVRVDFHNDGPAKAAAKILQHHWPDVADEIVELVKRSNAESRTLTWLQ